MVGNKRGFAIYFVVILIGCLSLLLKNLMQNSLSEHKFIGTFGSSLKASYSAQSGLNIRANEFYDLVKSGTTIYGTSPNNGGACNGTNLGTGHFACRTYSVNGRDVFTYIRSDQSTPLEIQNPSDTLFPAVYNYEQRYQVVAISRSPRVNETTTTQVDEFSAELGIYTRSYHLGSFDIFKKGDLVLNTATNIRFTNHWSIYADGDLFIDGSSVAGRSLMIDPLNLPVNYAAYYGSAPSSIPGGRAFNYTGRAWRGNPSGSRLAGVTFFGSGFYNSAGSRIELTDAQLTADYPTLKPYIKKSDSPYSITSFDNVKMNPGSVYWDRADVRIVLRLNGAENIDTTNSPTGVEVRNQNNTVNVAQTTALNNCLGRMTGGKAIGSSTTFYNHREGGYIKMLEADMRMLSFCLYDTDMLTTTNYLNSWYAARTAAPLATSATAGGTNFRAAVASDIGMVYYFGIDGPNSNTINRYGVRLHNTKDLGGFTFFKTVGGVSIGTAPISHNVTIATEQAVYLKGSFGSGAEIAVNCIPPLNTLYSCNLTTGTVPVNNGNANLQVAQLIADTVNVLSGAQNDANSALALGSRVFGYETNSAGAFTSLLSVAYPGTMPNSYRNYYQSYWGGSIITNANNETTPMRFLVPDAFRFHEDWSNANLSVHSKIAILGTPKHSNSTIATQSYALPDRSANTTDSDIQRQTHFANPSNGRVVYGIGNPAASNGSVRPPLPMEMIYIRKGNFKKRRIDYVSCTSPITCAPYGNY